jgi:hypothetical protein
MLDEDLRAQRAELVRPVATLPVPDIRVLRRRARRRGMRRAAAAAAITAVVAAVAIGVTVSMPGAPKAGRPAASGSGGGPKTWSAAPGTWTRGTWEPAGRFPADAAPADAPYFVEISGKSAAAAVVTDVFTGKVMSTVRPPQPGQSFAGVAAAGDDHTFVLAAKQTGSVGFYELRLGPGGGEESLSPLFTLPLRTVPRFAVSPDASLLAYTSDNGMEVVSLAAGTGRSWTASGGSASGAQAYGLSWGGDATVAFVWAATSKGPMPAGAGIRLLDIAAPGTLLQASRLLMPPCVSSQVCVGGPLITPDGSKVLATRITLSDTVTTNVEEYSARTGRPLAAETPPVRDPRGAQICQVLWTDPTGEQLAAFCGHAGVTDGTRFTRVNLQVQTAILLGSGVDFAW